MLPLSNIKRFFYKAIKQPKYAFSVFVKRFIANIFYYCGSGIAFMPESITLFLTYRCNLSCKMCGQWGDAGVTKKNSKSIEEELDFSVYTTFIDSVSYFRPNITLFGGEPLLYSKCIDLIRYIKNKRMHCILITNGFLVRDLAYEIVFSNLDELNISIDGPKNLHDTIRGLSGLFDKITSGLESIHKLKIKNKRRKPLVNIQCTITKYNYRYLEELIDVANDIGADSLTFHHLIFLNREILDEQREFDEKLQMSSKWWEGFVFEPDIDINVLYKKIRQIKHKRYNFSVDFYPNFSYKKICKYYNPNYNPKIRCLSPWIVSYIFPDGEVMPCLNYTYSLGNIKDNNFLDIWNGKPARHFRQVLKSNAILRTCIRCTELYRY